MAIQESFPSSANKIDTLLFDLDETLIQINRFGLELRFIFSSMRRMHSIIPVWKFYSVFWKSVKKSKTHGTDKTNHEVLVEALASYSKKSFEEVDRIIQKNLHDDFKKLKNHFTPVPGAKETLLLAHKLGYRVIIATNPSIPLCTVKLRLKWAGLEDFPFEYITNSEVMTRCKPDPAFYSELLDRLALDSKKCLMVGNDIEKDLAAKKIGILTYILKTRVTQKQIKKCKGDLHLEGYGDYPRLQEWLRTSPPGKEQKLCPPSSEQDNCQAGTGTF